MKVLTFALVFIVSLSCALAWANPEADSNASPSTQNAVESAVEDQIEASDEATNEGVPETLRHKDRPLTVMDQPLDGSSKEAFTTGLEKVDSEATEKEYRTLMSALDFLLFYDLAAKREKAKLYARLNGKSPNEIITTVVNTRGTGRSKKAQNKER